MTHSSNRFAALDGWRGLSILLVLACHMLPLGPKDFKLNLLAGAMGMSLFFTLSGFLIVGGLLKNPEVGPFLVRRLFRILPLAWLAVGVGLILGEVTPPHALDHLFFFANYSDTFSKTTLHFWSLCVEVHFYVFMAFLVAAGKAPALKLLPFILAGLSLLKLFYSPSTGLDGMATHWRVDELLGGGCLALLYHSRSNRSERARQLLTRVPFVAILALHVASCADFFPQLHFLRAYFAPMLIGWTLLRANSYVTKPLDHAFLRYVATVSYAVYVIHPFTMYGWMSEGDVLVRYSKRIVCFALTFGLAHLSTHYFESYFTELGKKIANRLKSRSGISTDRVGA